MTLLSTRHTVAARPVPDLVSVPDDSSEHPADQSSDHPSDHLGWLKDSGPARRLVKWRLDRQSLPTFHAPTPLRVPTRATGGVAFVFQGGGSLTAPQVGMLRALVEAGITPDLVVGTSAGALNAVSFAADPTADGLDRLEQIWMLLRRKHVAPWSVRAFAGAVFGRSDGLLSNAALRNLLSNGMAPPRLEETAIPAHVVATDVDTGEPVVLSSGDTVAALLASCALPLFYPPVEVDGRRLIDGGVAADVPVLQAEALGAGVCYVFGSAEMEEHHSKALRGPWQIALHALDHVLISAVRRDVAAASGRVYVLPTVTSAITNPMDFRDTARMIEQGYRQTVDWLADHAPAGATPTEFATSVS